LSELIDKQRDQLFEINSQFLTGIAAEMDRIIRVYGGEPREICVFSLFKALSLYSGYLNYFDRDRRKEIVKNSVLPYLDSVVAIATKGSGFDDVTKLLAKIVFDWRICYIQFLERPSIMTVEERKVSIGEETKKKLSESVEKALEQEVK
jgi:hypothetical protein